MDPIDALAEEMLGVFREHRLVRRTSAEIGSLSLADAYSVQGRVLARRVADGERPAGWKVGCTSRAIREQFGLTEPVRARLMHPHVHPSGTSLAAEDHLGCAVEPELVLRIGATIDPEATEDADLLRCISAVSAGVEVHHYAFVHGEPTSQELIASNAIHASLVVSDAAFAPGGVDLGLDGVGVWVGGRLAASGIGAEIMGAGPLQSLRWLVRHLDASGQRVEAGELVLPGSAVGLVRVAAGDEVQARFGSFGSCRVSFR